MHPKLPKRMPLSKLGELVGVERILGSSETFWAFPVEFTLMTTLCRKFRLIVELTSRKKPNIQRQMIIDSKLGAGE